MRHAQFQNNEAGIITTVEQMNHNIYDKYPNQLSAALSTQELSGSEHNLFWPALQRLLPTDATSVLDMGCGSGVFTEKLVSLYPQAAVIGVDSAADMLPVDGSAKYDNVDILKYPDAIQGPFDLIVAKMMLHYIDQADMAQFCAALVERLEPGGTLVCSVPHPCNSAHYLPEAADIITPQLIKREIARSGIQASMWHRSPIGWDGFFEELLINNPEERFADHNYELITDSVMNSDGDWRRYNFAFVSGDIPGAQAVYKRIIQDNLAPTSLQA